MALTGLDIYKQLPKKNCGECGPPTCLAFAMALAAGKGNLDACPYVSDEARANLASASAPPIRLVKFGPAARPVEIGDETVLFRHEKTFLHQTAIAIKVSDLLSTDEVRARTRKIADICLERVGQEYRVDAVAISNDSGDASAFARAVSAAAAAADIALVLVSASADALLAGLEAAPGKPVLYGADAGSLDRLAEAVKARSVPLVITARDLDELAELADKAGSLGVKDIILEASGDRSQRLAHLTQMRRLAIKKKFRPFGHPLAAIAGSDCPEDAVIEAINLVAKYASMVIVNATEPHQLLPLLTWRQNVYTDPQKPIQVQPQVYEVGQVTDESPVYVTTNFSLTYFSVEGEVEASKQPAYIVAVDTDGTSVLTSWAAGKFTGETVAEFLKKCGVEDRVKHRSVIIPGHVAVISGKLQDSSGWKVVVGPREASGIPGFVRGGGTSS